MKTIWKYVIYINDVPQPLQLPDGARIVHVDSQRTTLDVVTFWAEVDDENEMRERLFQVFGTGHPIPHTAAYVGTAMPVPELVWHLFELPTDHAKVNA